VHIDIYENCSSKERKVEEGEVEYSGTRHTETEQLSFGNSFEENYKL
jgi:hypothetical protein